MSFQRISMRKPSQKNTRSTNKAVRRNSGPENPDLLDLLDLLDLHD